MFEIIKKAFLVDSNICENDRLVRKTGMGRSNGCDFMLGGKVEMGWGAGINFC